MKASKLSLSKQRKLTPKRSHIDQVVENQGIYRSKPSKKVKTEAEIMENPGLKSNFYDGIEEVPAVYLTTKQMNSDPLALILELQQKYKEYGAVKLIASDSWNPPFTFRYIDKKLTTRIQHLNQLKQGKVSLFQDTLFLIGKEILTPLGFLYIQPFGQKIEKYTIKQFEILAREYDRTYTFKTDAFGKTMESKLEMEYWNLVSSQKYENDPKAQVSVEYAADLASSKYGSGFPTRKMHNWLDADFEYENNLFNFNNIYKSPNSLLAMTEARRQKISGFTLPWVYMAMKFSTFCWHVEDLWINSINVNHMGGIKNWYVIPPKYKEKFDQFVQKKFCEANPQKKNLLNRITFMVDPQQLIKNGIKIYKIYQNPREFVCTFFKAYHCGFSHSFNVGQAVNFITSKSLDFIKQSLAFQKLSGNNKPPVISFEWLVVQNILKSEKFGQSDRKKIKAYYQSSFQQSFENLQNIIQKFEKKIKIVQVEIIEPKIKYDKNYCADCKSYQYLSSIKCKQCLKNRCFRHFQVCCNGQCILLLRKIDQLIQKFACLVPSLKKQIGKSYKNKAKQAFSALKQAKSPSKHRTNKSIKK